jgi:hypothetical protein
MIARGLGNYSMIIIEILELIKEIDSVIIMNISASSGVSIFILKLLF